MDAEKLLRYCVEKLVDKPEVLIISKVSTPEKIVFEVKVDPSDRARIIGRQGMTFKALRALLNLTTPQIPFDIVIETTE